MISMCPWTDLGENEENLLEQRLRGCVRLQTQEADSGPEAVLGKDHSDLTLQD